MIADMIYSLPKPQLQACCLFCQIISAGQPKFFLPGLTELQLTCCSSLASIPASISAMNSLRSLALENCSSINSLPMLPPALQALNMTGCERLRSLPQNLEILAALVRLDMHGCPAFDALASARLTAAVYCNQLADWERHKRPSAFAEMLTSL